MTAAVERQAAIEATYRARTARSAALHAQAVRVFPGGVTRSVTLHAPYPTYLAEGSGCEVRDVDGHWYLDCVNNYGSMIHGHGHAGVVTALREQVVRGAGLGAPTELQLALARAIAARVPSIEHLRFTTSGTEAVLYALRAARAFTGRQGILKIEGAYHGGYDAVAVSVNPGVEARAWPYGVVASEGLPEDVLVHTLVAPFNDLDTAAGIMRDHRHELAAVIVEPVMVRGMIAAEPEFLRGLREVTRELGVLLIFDEVVTFRLAAGGAQERVGVRPDLTTLGKLIGGGLPVGAVGGRADIMAGFDPAQARPVHHSGTFAGNAATMAAGLAALAAYGPGEIRRLNQLGDRLRDGLARVAAGAGVPAVLTGAGSLVGVHLGRDRVRDYRSALPMDPVVIHGLHLGLLNRGVFTRAAGGFFLSTAMQNGDVDRAIATFGAALEDLTPLLTGSSPS